MVYTYLIYLLIQKVEYSLNPCCNGWCTHTILNKETNLPKTVLILVVMDGVHILDVHTMYHLSTPSLNPCCNGWCTHTIDLLTSS